MQILDEFVEAVMSRWPKTVLQFEDFQLQYAHTLLQRYKHQHLVFNDDIQASVTSQFSPLSVSPLHVLPLHVLPLHVSQHVQSLHVSPLYVSPVHVSLLHASCSYCQDH